MDAPRRPVRFLVRVWLATAQSQTDAFIGEGTTDTLDAATQFAVQSAGAYQPAPSGGEYIWAVATQGRFNSAGQWQPLADPQHTIVNGDGTATSGWAAGKRPLR